MRDKLVSKTGRTSMGEKKGFTRGGLQKGTRQDRKGRTKEKKEE